MPVQEDTLTTPAFVPAPVKPAISLRELERVDLRVGTVETVEDVAKSPSLCVSQ